MIRHIALQTQHGSLHGRLGLPEHPRGLILVVRAHRLDDDELAAAEFEAHGYATLSIDLLTTQELQFVDATQNVPRLAQRLLDVLDLIRNDGDMQTLPLGLFANGDTAPAAIRCAAQRDIQVKALACHGGLIDRSGVQSLELMVAPLLMLFDHDDELAPAAFQRAARHLGGPHETRRLAPLDKPLPAVASWFARHLRA